LGIVDKVAMSDQEFRLLALRMYTTTAQARELKLAMTSLGQPLEMIAWDPELARRFGQLVKDQQTMTEQLGPDFERQMLRIRDVRFEFNRFGMELKYLTMFVVRDLGKVLGVNIDDIAAKLKNWNNWIIANMPQISIWLEEKLKPILKDVKGVLYDTWNLLKMTGAAFTDMVGILSGDKSLEGTTVSFDKMATAIQHVIGWIKDLIEDLIRAEEAVIHVENAAAAVKNRKFGEARKELQAALGVSTQGSMAVTGAIAGTAMAGVPGGIIGGVGGYLAGIPGEYRKLSQQLQANQIEEIATTAKYASSRLGIPWQLILSQWLHETGGLTDYKVDAMHNLGGIRKGGQYQSFGSFRYFADKYISVLSGPQFAGIPKPGTPEEMAAYLKQGHYYEDLQSNYAAGLKRWSPAAASIENHISVLVNVTEPKATADEISHKTANAVAEKTSSQAQRNMTEFGYTGVSY
jgi:hypothetical protein